MSRIADTYLAGGVSFMHSVTLLLLANLIIAGYIIYSRSNGKTINTNWLEAIKHLGGFAVAFGTFGTLTGLFLAFDALERSEQVLPFQLIMGGLKVSLINVLYGLIVFFFSMIVYIVLKLRQVKVQAETKNVIASINVMITSITLICLIIGFAFFIRRLYKLRKKILSRWESAFRHIVAILAGLCAFVGLFGLLRLLDLLERDAFSLNALFSTLQVSLALLIGGGIIVAASLVLSVEDR